MAHDSIVLKFGSSVLRSAADLPAAVHEIYSWYRRGWRVVAIVSAIGNSTEALLRDAHAFCAEPEPSATAELLATGERHSAALLGIALDRAGVASRVVDPREIGLQTQGTVLDSEAVGVDRGRIEALLDEFPVVVVPGFFGYDSSGRLHLLGRGGSDLTAVYLANALGTRRCRLVKDVDGVYERDPALSAPAPSRRFVTMGYAEAVERATQLIQPKAVRFLERFSASAEVAAVAHPYETVVGPLARELTEAAKPAPLSVLILGLGTVGLGVHQRLSAMPEHFRVAGILVRDRAQHAAAGIPSELLHSSPDSLVDLRPDIVVDALPGVQPSQSLVRYYLMHGAHVVSANKALIAEAGPELTAIAQRNGVTLCYSAAVGGSAPMIEAVRRAASADEVQSIAGILNGTCNYVLDRCTDGLLLNEAVRAAQACGFAEVDPSNDLLGHDAARKLSILACEAFGHELDAIEVDPLNTAVLLRNQSTQRENQTLRVVARAWKLGNKYFGQIRLEAVPTDDPFAQTRNEWNRLRITRANGADITVSGRGAGRWPTTEAVIADLLQICAQHAAAAQTRAEARNDTSIDYPIDTRPARDTTTRQSHG